MESTIVLQEATSDDAPRISVLLTELAEEFIVGEFSAKGRRHLLAHFGVAEMAVRPASEEYRFQVAEREAVLIGYAVPAYRRLGFTCVGTILEKNGVRFQPMEWVRGT